MIATKMSVIYVVSVIGGGVLSKISLKDQLGASFLVARHSQNDNLLLLSKLGRFAEVEFVDGKYLQETSTQANQTRP